MLVQENEKIEKYDKDDKNEMESKIKNGKDISTCLDFYLNDTTIFAPQTQTHPQPHGKKLQTEFVLFAQQTQYNLFDKVELIELKEFIETHEGLLSVFKTPDNLVHVLKVIESIKPNQRVSTFDGVYIQREPESNEINWYGWFRQKAKPLCVIRKIYGDDRISNIRAIKSIFIGSLMVIEMALQEREELFLPIKPLSQSQSNVDNLPTPKETAPTFGSDINNHHNNNDHNNNKGKITKPTPIILSQRNDFTCKLKNKQLIDKMIRSLSGALTGLQNLKTTYSDDAHVCSFIGVITETMNDRILLIKESLKFFENTNLAL